MVQTRLRVAPGDQLADVVYNLSVLPLVKGIAQEFQALGYALVLGDVQGCTSLARETLSRTIDDAGHGASYVDDIMTPAQIPADKSLADSIPILLRAIHQQTASRGFVSHGRKLLSLRSQGMKMIGNISTTT